MLRSTFPSHRQTQTPEQSHDGFRPHHHASIPSTNIPDQPIPKYLLLSHSEKRYFYLMPCMRDVNKSSRGRQPHHSRSSIFHIPHTPLAAPIPPHVLAPPPQKPRARYTQSANPAASTGLPGTVRRPIHTHQTTTLCLSGTSWPEAYTPTIELRHAIAIR